MPAGITGSFVWFVRTTSSAYMGMRFKSQLAGVFQSVEDEPSHVIVAPPEPSNIQFVVEVPSDELLAYMASPLEASE